MTSHDWLLAAAIAAVAGGVVAVLQRAWVLFYLCVAVACLAVAAR